MKILVADDDPVTRRLLEAALVKLGHPVTVVADGAQAWDSWMLARNRVIVSDWQMPDMDGLELCARIRARAGEPYTYFIMLTSRSGRDDYNAAMDAGVDDFLTKPIDLDELAARLRVAARILGLRKELESLEGMLPICTYCKRIRDDAGEYEPIERYVERRAQARFSHGICPDCYITHIQPQLDKLPERPGTRDL